MPKVSVIVPVYNVEKYLDRCLDSLVNQTLQEIEIIVINDSTPDQSQIIIDKYYEEAVEEFRNFMFDYIYCSPQLTVEHNKAEHVVRTLMDLYMESPQLLPREYGELADRFGLKQTVVDFVGGLTDAGAVQLFNKHYIPII